MKLKISALFVVLTIVSTNFAMIEMPTAEVLEERLNKAGFGHYMEKTDIVESLANKELVPIGVHNIVFTSMLDYSKHLEETMPGPYCKAGQAAFYIRKRQLFEVLLEDFPEALKELEENEFIGPK